MPHHVVNALGSVEDVANSGVIALEKAFHHDFNHDEGIGRTGQNVNYTTMRKWPEEKLNKFFNATNYDNVAPYMGTGDLLLFHGSNSTNAVIANATRSWWTHIGVIVKDPPAHILNHYPRCHMPPADGLYLFESDAHYHDGREGGGVQVIPLRHRMGLAGEGYFFGWRRLHLNPQFQPRGQPISAERKASEFPGLLDLMVKVKDYKYEKDKPSLIRAIVHGNKRDTSSLFCAELAAWALQVMQVFNNPGDINPSNWLSPDFSHIHRNDHINREISRNGNYGRDIRVIWCPESGGTQGRMMGGGGSPTARMGYPQRQFQQAYQPQPHPHFQRQQAPLSPVARKKSFHGAGGMMGGAPASPTSMVAHPQQQFQQAHQPPPHPEQHPPHFQQPMPFGGHSPSSIGRASSFHGVGHGHPQPGYPPMLDSPHSPLSGMYGGPSPAHYSPFEGAPHHMHPHSGPFHPGAGYGGYPPPPNLPPPPGAQLW